MSLMNRQRSTFKLHQEQVIPIHQPFTNFDQDEHHLDDFYFNSSHNDQISSLGEILIKPEPGMEIAWNDDFERLLNCVNEFEFGMSCNDHMIPRTTSCLPNVAEKMATDERKEVTAAASSSSAAGREFFKKRKSDKCHDIKAVTEKKSQEKKMKVCVEEESKITEQNSTITTTTTTDHPGKNISKNNKGTNCKGNKSSRDHSKSSESPKPDYIHVRARRGQATDSHSLAERVRREKISERMRFLQDLVPGCNKVTGKAGMLDEIINYVQSLQNQVEFLSMKLATINPTTLDFDADNFQGKEVIYPTIDTLFDNLDHLQFNAVSHGISSSGLGTGIINPQDATLRRTISAPVSIPDSFFDSFCSNQPAWDNDLMRRLYGIEFEQARSTAGFM